MMMCCACRRAAASQPTTTESNRPSSLAVGDAPQDRGCRRLHETVSIHAHLTRNKCWEHPCTQFTQLGRKSGRFTNPFVWTGPGENILEKRAPLHTIYYIIRKHCEIVDLLAVIGFRHWGSEPKKVVLQSSHIC